MMAFSVDQIRDFDRFLLTDFDLITVRIFVDYVDNNHKIALKC